MKKLIVAAAATAFVLGTSLAMAEDTKQSNPTEKTPTQQQMDTQKTGGSKMKAGTTGAGMTNGKAGMTNGKPGDSKLPNKGGETTTQTGK